MRTILTVLVLCSPFVTTCGGESDPFERVQKLRALGVQTHPLTVIPSTEAKTNSVELTFHLLVPRAQEVKAESYVDVDSIYSVPTKVKLDHASAAYEEVADLRHYTIKATIIIPSENDLVFQNGLTASLRYAVLFTSGDDEEKVVGTVLVQKDTKSKTYAPLEINIILPKPATEITRDKEMAIESSIENKNNEALKVGWFVNDGSIENRRAKKTKWTTGKKDKQLLIATVRGMVSQSFAVKILEVNAK